MLFEKLLFVGSWGRLDVYIKFIGFYFESFHFLLAFPLWTQFEWLLTFNELSFVKVSDSWFVKIYFSLKPMIGIFTKLMFFQVGFHLMEFDFRGFNLNICFKVFYHIKIWLSFWIVSIKDFYCSTFLIFHFTVFKSFSFL